MPYSRERPLVGRSRELGALRRALDLGPASEVRVTGLPGVGKTRLVRQAASDFPHVLHRAPPLPEPLQRRALAAALPSFQGAGAGEGRPSPAGAGEPPSWEDLFAALAAAGTERRPAVLVVDDAHRWEESRARYAPALAAALARARAAGRPFHVVLVSPEALPPLPGAEAPLRLRLAPLPFRAAAALLPGADPADLLRAYGVFGGVPGNLALLDREASPATNLRRLVLAPEAPLADAPLRLLERLFQAPTRYAAILAALAHGEGDWSVVHGGVPDLTASGQAAPYLKRLEEVGLVETRRSLDAPPRSRSRRYRITDPFTAFWFRWILSRRHAPPRPDARPGSEDVPRAELDVGALQVHPQACRDFMLHDAVEVLGSNAREAGSLWGSGYDIPVAGVLANGAPFYGTPVEAAAAQGATSPLAKLDAQVRETRYGFGRERRLRVLFPLETPGPTLVREAARRHDTVLVGLAELAGG